MKKILLLASLTALTSNAFALTASDDASNYGGGWNDSDNGGTGFGAWDLTDNNDDNSTLFAGYFLGDSTAGAGNINTSGNSFGVYANPSGQLSAFAVAKRSFGSSLSVNDRFTFDMALNFDNGNKGFTLRNNSDQEVFGFNVGSGGSINTAFTNNAVTANYDYGGNDAMIAAVLTVISATEIQYEISRIATSGTTGVLFSGSISGISGTLDTFTFYNSGTDNGDPQNNLYFNNLSVTNVPEPSTYALIAGLLALGWVMQARRR